MENGYHLYDFKGELLREEHLDKFKQLLWRPRPPTMLSKDEQKQIRKNLREYSKDFEEQDRIEEDKEKGAIVDERRRMLSEWLAWREREQEDLRADRRELGLPEDPEEEEAKAAEGADGEDATVVEEIVEEVLDEIEEIVA
jgi:translation initiation factor 3 subunit B